MLTSTCKVCGAVLKQLSPPCDNCQSMHLEIYNATPKKMRKGPTQVRFQETQKPLEEKK